MTTDALPAGPVGDDPDGWDDYDDFVPPAPRARRLPALTLALAACAVAGAGVLGGVLIQKHWGSTSSGGGQGLANGVAALANRGGATAGNATAAGGAGGQRGLAGGLAGDNGTVGTVKAIDGNAVYVTDLEGNVVKVTTSKATTITVTDTGKVTDLSPGDTVVVQGAKTASGWNATSVSEGGGGAGRFGGFRGGGSGAPIPGGASLDDGSSTGSTEAPALPGLGG